MLVLSLKLLITYHAQNYASIIIGTTLVFKSNNGNTISTSSWVSTQYIQATEYSTATHVQVPHVNYHNCYLFLYRNTFSLLAGKP